MTRSDYGNAYEKGFNSTLRFLISKGVPHDAAEETAQAAWTRGWERIHQLADAQVVSTWVNTIALNMYRRSVHFDNRNHPLSEASGGAGVDIAAIELSNLLKSCCTSDRTLLLHQLHGLTTREMAQEVGVTETAVRLRLMRARRSARSLIEGREAVRSQGESSRAASLDDSAAAA
jgi:DNA-directed RNA polymerase specialized sigma24 family protein